MNKKEREQQLKVLGPILQDQDLCTLCKGQCCKDTGCIYSPHDFSVISEESLEALLSEGNTSIMYQIHPKINKGFFILKMRNKESPIVDYPPYGGGGCCLLTEDGCPLPFKKRPMSAKLLVPNAAYEGGKIHIICMQLYLMDESYIEWLPYQKMLSRLAKKFS